VLIAVNQNLIFYPLEDEFYNFRGCLFLDKTRPYIILYQFELATMINRL